MTTERRPFWLSSTPDGELTYHGEHPESGRVHDAIAALLAAGDAIPTQPPPLGDQNTHHEDLARIALQRAQDTPPVGAVVTMELTRPVTFSVEANAQTLSCPRCANNQGLLVTWATPWPVDTATATCACARRWTSLLVQAVALYYDTPE